MDLIGKRVLIVEDEFLVALGLQDNLMSLGCVVVGPAGSLADAMNLAETETVDAAILDVNLRGELVFPVADVLADRGVPMIFCSGHMGIGRFPERFSDCTRVPKPYTSAIMAAALREMLESSTKAGRNSPNNSAPSMSM